MRIIIYSCIVDKYDKKIPEMFPCPCIDDAILFTDSRDVASSGWTVRELISLNDINRSDLINRYHKFFPHLIFENIDVSIYIDGNIEVRKNIEPLIDEFLKSGKPFGCLMHPQRDNIVQELEACIHLKKFKKGDQYFASDQVNSYLSRGFPVCTKLQAATIIFRRHDKVDLLHSAMSLWWSQVNRYTCRDQLSLPYVLWKTGLPFISLDLDLFNNEYFLRRPHNKISVVNRIKSKTRKVVEQVFSF